MAAVSVPNSTPENLMAGRKKGIKRQRRIFHVDVYRAMCPFQILFSLV